MAERTQAQAEAVSTAERHVAREPAVEPVLRVTEIFHSVPNGM